jgi:hypothetical protein
MSVVIITGLPKFIPSVFTYTNAIVCCISFIKFASLIAELESFSSSLSYLIYMTCSCELSFDAISIDRYDN